jgi:hypothetical protein
MLSVLPQSSVYDPIEGLIPASEFTTEIPWLLSRICSSYG